MPSISQIIAVLALLNSSERNISKAGMISSMFSSTQEKKDQLMQDILVNQTGQIDMEFGDPQLGEIIWHPKNVDLSDPQSKKNYQHVDFNLIQQKIQEEEANFKQIVDNQLDQKDQKQDTENKPIGRLNLNGEFKDSLLEEAMSLNEDFLSQAQFMFAEYLGLNMIQLIFEENLGSPDFIQIFKSSDGYQPALDVKLLKVQKIVEEEVKKFSEEHKVEQTKMMKQLVDDYIKKLSEKEKLNKGFPDTEAMRVALFGQVAFKYEQQCQSIYKKISEKYIQECTNDAEKLIQRIDSQELEQESPQYEKELEKLGKLFQ